MSDLATPAQPSRHGFSPWRFLGFLVLFVVMSGSLVLNLLVILVAIGIGGGMPHEEPINERHYSGDKTASEKVAVVQLEGVLMDGTTGFMRKQIERAATDPAVKAVVLRINSPGGTITASDELHRRIVELRDGNVEKHTAAKPLVVSMGSIAASGGYYIAMPAKTLLAERTTVTGSIGVYAALPNAVELSNKIGFTMTLFRAGDVKDSGSPFRDMSEKEKKLWQSMVDHSYLQFLSVVEAGRPHLIGILQEDIVIDETVRIRDDKALVKQVKYTRYRADGGIFMADAAKKYGLIDDIGSLDDGIKAARKAANLGENCQVVQYDKPVTLLGSLLGIKARQPESVLDPNRLAEGAVPRLWYLTPQSEMAGFLAAMGQKEQP